MGEAFYQANANPSGFIPRQETYTTAEVTGFDVRLLQVLSMI